MEFGERLLLVLKEREITQRELAEKININETALSRYVNGSRKPRMDILVNIARALNVSVEYLTGETRAHRIPRREPRPPGPASGIRWQNRYHC